MRAWPGFFGAADVIWATDSGQQVARLLQVTTLGTTIVIDRRGHVSYRDGGATPYKILLAQVGNVL